MRNIFQVSLGNGFVSDKNCMKNLSLGVKKIQAKLLTEFGISVPNIRICADENLKEREYEIFVSGKSVKKFSCKENCLLAVDTGDVSQKIAGIATKEPSFGVDAVWISEEQKIEAQNAGYKVVTHEELLKVNLNEMIKENLSVIVTTRYVKNLLGETEKKDSSLVAKLKEKHKDEYVSVVKAVFASLLDEKVSVKELEAILNAICRADSIGESIIYARKAVAQSIVSPYVADGILHCIFPSQQMLSLLEVFFESCELDDGKKVIENFAHLISRASEQECYPIIVVPEKLRFSLHSVLELYVPDVKVFSEEEVNIAKAKNNFRVLAV